MEKYRADIDGLRAVSVLAVILFHAGLGLPGGFVGVDVFFVISGYLITSLIAADLDRGVFSLSGFWERRIRRIWPAALALTAGTLVAGWLLMLPADYRRVSRDALAQIGMVANFRYWLDEYYFGPAADLRPLLHTWSLAVEEQFYVFHPLCMLAVWKRGKVQRLVVFSTIAVASFCASAMMLEYRASFVFYMLPTRAWEMLLGVILALLPGTAASRIPWPRWTCEAFGVCGIILVLLPMMIYGRHTPFPGLHALPPCLGTTLLIATGSGTRPSLSNRILATSPLRLVGRMSYSLYLWHWPVFAFLRYCGGNDLVYRWIGVVFLGITVVAFLSWKYIEQPFRRSTTATGSPMLVFGTAALASLLVAGTSLWIDHTGGVPQRLKPETLHLLASAEHVVGGGRFTQPDDGKGFPAFGRDAAGDGLCVFVWGDSHAMAISSSIDAICRELGIAGEFAMQTGTPPLPNVWRPLATFNKAPARSLATAWTKSNLDRLRARRPKHVILCARWSIYLRDNQSLVDNTTIAPLDSEDATADTAVMAMHASLQQLKEVCAETGSKLWVFLEVPDQEGVAYAGVEKLALRLHWSGTMPALTGVSRNQHAFQQRLVRWALSGDAVDGIRIVDLAAPFFDRDGLSQLGCGHRLWYADTNHLSIVGAKEVLSPVLREVFREIAADCE